MKYHSSSPKKKIVKEKLLQTSDPLIPSLPSVSWFPGHMKKTTDLIKKNLNKVEVIIEILDARIPLSSRNSLITKLTLGKPRVIILNKSDLADPVETSRWMDYFLSCGYQVKVLSCLKQLHERKKVINQISVLLRKAMGHRPNSSFDKPNLNKNFTAMICGIPNVGKSTLINFLSGHRKTVVGNRPGVTMHKQFIRINSNWLILDMPGLLKHKLNDWESLHMCCCGIIKDNIFDPVEHACKLLEKFFINQKNIVNIFDFYQILEPSPNWDALEILKQIGLRKKMLLKKAEINYPQVALNLIRDFRLSNLGKITLEKLDDYYDILVKK